MVRLWDVNEQPFPPSQATPVGTIEPGGEIRDLFVTDDPEFPVLAFDTEGFGLLLDFSTGEDLQLDPPDEFVDATVNLDLTVFVGITDDGVLRVYDFDDDLNFNPGPTVEVNPDGVTDLVVSPDGRFVAWGDGPELALWSWRDGGEPQIENVVVDEVDDEVDDEIVRTEVVAVSFSPDDDPSQAVVAVGMDDGTVVLVDRNDPSLFERVDPGSVNQLFDLAFKPDAIDFGDGEGDVTFRLASTHGNGDVILYEVVPDGELAPFGFVIETMRGHNDETRKVAFAPDGRIASGDFLGEVIWWLDVPISSLGFSLPLPAERTSPLYDGAFVTANQIVAVDADFTAWLMDLESSDVRPIVDDVRVTSVDATNEAIAVGLADGSAAILDQEGNLVRSLAADHPLLVHVVALSSDGRRLATVSPWVEDGPDGHLAIWDATTGALSSEQDLPEGFEPFSALFADDGFLWVGGQDREDLPTVLRFDGASGTVDQREIRHSSREGNAVTALALSDDGRTLATGSLDKRISLWDTETLEARPGGEFTGHRGNVTGIVFWDGGETLISSDDAGDVLMWDVSGRRQFGRLGGPGDDVKSLEIDTETATLLASSEDGLVWTWTLDPDKWRSRACELAGRNMTQAEWDSYGDGTTRVRHCVDLRSEEGDARDAEYHDSLTD